MSDCLSVILSRSKKVTIYGDIFKPKKGLSHQFGILSNEIDVLKRIVLKTHNEISSDH